MHVRNDRNKRSHVKHNIIKLFCMVELAELFVDMLFILYSQFSIKNRNDIKYYIVLSIIIYESIY